MRGRGRSAELERGVVERGVRARDVEQSLHQLARRGVQGSDLAGREARDDPYRAARTVRRSRSHQRARVPVRMRERRAQGQRLAQARTQAAIGVLYMVILSRLVRYISR